MKAAGPRARRFCTYCLLPTDHCPPYFISNALSASRSLIRIQLPSTTGYACVCDSDTFTFATSAYFSPGLKTTSSEAGVSASSTSPASTIDP